jgi:drug/metabolite transporter (DMT)-like permease
MFLYFSALALGDPARITLVTYVWPIGFIIAVRRMHALPVELPVFAGAALAFTGIVPLITSDATGVATPMLAYAAGIASGGCWIAFSLYLRHAPALGFGGYARLFLHAAVAAAVLYGLSGGLGTTAPVDWLAAAAIGFGPYGIAFMSWGFALRRGPSGVLGILNYFVPIIAALLLILFGRSEPQPALFVAAAAVVGGSLLASHGRPRRAR